MLLNHSHNPEPSRPRGATPRVLTAEESAKREEIIAKIRGLETPKNPSLNCPNFENPDEVEKNTFSEIEETIVNFSEGIDENKVREVAGMKNLNEILKNIGKNGELLANLQNESLHGENKEFAVANLNMIIVNIAEEIRKSYNPIDVYFNVLGKITHNSEINQKICTELILKLPENFNYNEGIQKIKGQTVKNQFILGVISHNSRISGNAHDIKTGLSILKQNLDDNTIETLSNLVAKKMKNSDDDVLYTCLLHTLRIVDGSQNNELKNKIYENLESLRYKAGQFLINSVDKLIGRINSDLQEIESKGFTEKKETSQALQKINNIEREINGTRDYISNCRSMFPNLDIQSRLETIETMLNRITKVSEILRKKQSELISKKINQKIETLRNM